MSYKYLLEFEWKILQGHSIKFFCAELITEDDREEIEDFFDCGDNSIDLTQQLGMLSSDGEFILDISPSSVQIKRVTIKEIEDFVSFWGRKSIGSFSFMDVLKGERRTYMRINVGDSVMFKEDTSKYSTNTILKVFARLGNIIYIKGDQTAYTLEQFKRIGE